MKKEIALRVDGMRILLTVDQMLMSKHRQNEFLGFRISAETGEVASYEETKEAK